MAAEQAAILKWLDTFPNAAGPADFSSLNDGTRLAAALRTIAGDGYAFPELQAADGDSWVLRSSNLKKLIRALRNFYNEALDKDADFEAHVDVGAAAKGEDGGAGALALARFVLGCAVECEAKQTYVQALMALDVETQTVLMRMIQEVMALTHPASRGAADPFSNEEDLDGGAAGAGGGADGGASGEALGALQAELGRKDEALRALQEELARVKAETAQQARLGEEAAEAGLELERLRMELRKSEVAITDLEVAIERSKAETADARKATEAAQEQRKQLAADAEGLAEEVDVLRGKEDQLARCEAQMERMRGRLEQLSVYPKRLEEQDAKAAEYFQQVLALEAEVKEVAALRTRAEQYKEKASKAEQDKFDALSDAAVKEAEILRLRGERDEAASERALLEERIASLREEVRAANERPSMSGDAAPADTGVFGDAMELREKALRLEHENAVLRQEAANLREQAGAAAAGGAAAGAAAAAAASASSEGDALLRADLEDALRVKSEREEALLREKKRCAELEHELARLRGDAESRGAEAQSASKAMESELNSLRAQLEESGRLTVRNESLTKSLSEREAEVARLVSEKEKIEAFTKRALKTVHEKYTHSLQIVKDEAQARQRRVEHLENKIDSIKAAQKREERLMVSAVYELGLQMMNRQIFGPEGAAAEPPSPASVPDASRNTIS